MYRLPDFIFFRLLKLRTVTAESGIASEIVRISNVGSEKIEILYLRCGKGGHGDEILNLTPDTIRERINLVLVDVNQDLIGRKVFNIVPRKIVGTATEILNEFQTHQFGIVVCLEVLEHLTESNGDKTLYEIDQKSSKSTILATTNSFVWQPDSLNNPFNAHISGRNVSELRKHGFSKLTGISGYKYQNGPYAIEREDVKFKRFTNYTFPKSQIFLKLSFSLLAIKQSQINSRIVFQ